MINHISELTTSRFWYPSGASLTTVQLDNPRYMKSIDYNTLNKYRAVTSSLSSAITTESLSSYLAAYNDAIQDDEFELSMFNARKYNYPVDMIKAVSNNTELACRDYVDNKLPSLTTATQYPYPSSRALRGFANVNRNIKSIDLSSFNIDLNYYDFFVPTNPGTSPDPYSRKIYTTQDNIYYKYLCRDIDISSIGGAGARLMIFRVDNGEELHSILIYFVRCDQFSSGTRRITESSSCVLNFDTTIGENCFPIYVECLGEIDLPVERGTTADHPCIKVQLPQAFVDAMSRGDTLNNIKTEDGLNRFKLRLASAIFKS